MRERGYMVDTCIINRLIDGFLSTADFRADAALFATHIQVDELSKTRDEERRKRLLTRFSTLVDSVVNTDSGCWDVSRWDSFNWSDGDLFGRLKADLDSRNKKKVNNTHDALIAEAAIVNGYTLLTADSDLAEVATKHGCIVEYFR